MPFVGKSEGCLEAANAGSNYDDVEVLHGWTRASRPVADIDKVGKFNRREG